jgi:DNA-binding beta-propeller fold protein YncE
VESAGSPSSAGSRGHATARRYGTAAMLLAGMLSATVLISRGHASVIMRTVPIGGFVGAMAVDAQTGRAFAIGNGTVYVLDSSSGALVRALSIEPYTVGFTTIAADERTARIVVADDDGSAAGYVHLLDARSGTPLRALPLSLAPAGVAVDAESTRAFVVGNPPNAHHGTPGFMAMLDVRRGRLVRTVLLGRRALLTGAMSLNTRVHRIYVVYVDAGSALLRGTVATIEETSGRILHTLPIGPACTAPGPALAADEQSGRVFVICPLNQSLRVLTARNGSLMQTVPLHAYPTALAVDDATERVFVTTLHNTVVMVDAVSGRILRTVPVGLAPRALAVDPRSRRVFVVNEGSYDAKGYTTRDGSVSVLDALTGRVLRTVPLQGNGGLIAVDERAGRAFVTTYGRRVVRPLDPWAWIPSSLRRRLPFLPAPPAPRFAAASVTMIDATQ